MQNLSPDSLKRNALLLQLGDGDVQSFLLEFMPGAIDRAIAGDSRAHATLMKAKLAIALLRSRAPKKELERGQRSSVQRLEPFVGGNKAEQQWADYLADRITRQAAADPSILDSRKAMWGNDEPLSESKARAFLRSPILPFATKAELDDLGVPLVGHNATLTYKGSDKTAKIALDHIVRAPEWLRGGDIRARITWRGGKCTHVWRLPVLPEPDHLEFASVYGFPKAVPVRAGSVFDVIRQWSAEWAKWPPYSRWGVSHCGAPLVAVRFLLTGKAVALPVISVSGQPEPDFDTLKITAEVHVSRESLWAAFAPMQRLALEASQTGPVSPRAHAMRLFVDDWNRTEGKRVGELPGARVRRCWNDAFPDWRYDDPKQMRRAYIAAKPRAQPRRLVDAKGRLVDENGQPQTKKRSRRRAR